MERFNAWETYCAMYDVFEVRFVPGESIPEKAHYFLSEANPHIWQDETSGDPAIYSEFRQMFEAAFPDGAAQPWESAEVVKDFLASMQELYRFVDDISDDPDVDFWAVFDEVTEELSWPHFFGIEPFIGKVNPKVFQGDELALLGSLVGRTMSKYQQGSSVHMGNGAWEYIGIEVDGVMYELSATNVCVAYYKDLEDYCPCGSESSPKRSKSASASSARSISTSQSARSSPMCWCAPRSKPRIETGALSATSTPGQSHSSSMTGTSWSSTEVGSFRR